MSIYIDTLAKGLRRYGYQMVNFCTLINGTVTYRSVRTSITNNIQTEVYVYCCGNSNEIFEHEITADLELRVNQLDHIFAIEVFHWDDSGESKERYVGN